MKRSVENGPHDRAGTAWLRFAGIVVAVALCSALGTALFVQVSRDAGGTHVAEAPRPAEPSLPQRTAPDPPSEAPQQSAPEREVPTEPEPTPTGEPPAAPTPQRTRPTGVIDDCQGEPLSEPASLLLACGDAGRGLQNLTWTDWGGDTATARGTVWEKICVPDCADGGRAFSPATVTVSEPVGGRYTVMVVSAPRSPVEPVARYELDEQGPVDRG
jgi:hypothetical protein